MNSDTGQIYGTRDDILRAMRRGEPLEPIGPGIAEEDKKAYPPGTFEGARPVLNRRERRAQERLERKASVKFRSK